jgi:hypothetical protein
LSLPGDEDGVSRDDVATDTSELPSQDSVDPDADESLLPPDDRPTTRVVPGPRAEVVDLTGGRVSVSGANGKVRVIWSIPRPGYALLPAGTADRQPDQVTVVLSNGSHQSALIASWDPDEGLLIETREGGVTTNES